VEESGSGPNLMMDFGIGGVEPSDTAIRLIAGLVNAYIFLRIWNFMLSHKH
jgi:hypothetical protein